MILLIALFGGLVWLSFSVGYYTAKRNHGQVYVEECCTFTESAKELDNPNRGFYYIYGFVISDEDMVDYDELVAQKFSNSHDMSLAMVQINLRNYNDVPISAKGLEDIRKLFAALRKMEKEYLIRFLYDWDGNNLEVEPQDVELILTHMGQLEPVFKEYKDIIFVHQGIFIGNWGEMNGTKHLQHMQTLAETLQEVLQEETFLAVRMPAQWRKITETSNPEKAFWNEESIAHNLGLFNDGIMGNYGDYGTYGSQSRSEVGEFTHWNRAEELAFQEELCKYVPNGGEVIIDNSLNDFENALKDMKTMHISYLNRDYDQAVLDKWAKTIVTEPGVFKGMDGLSYMERHMGYRFLMKEVDLAYRWREDTLSVNISLQNVGFAPIYKGTDIVLELLQEETGEITSYVVSQGLSALTGGNDSDVILSLKENLDLMGLGEGRYSIYFKVKDANSGKTIYFANEQEMEELGYKLGSIYIESYSDFLLRNKHIN